MGAHRAPLQSRVVRSFLAAVTLLSALPAMAQTAITNIQPSDASSNVAIPAPIVVAFNTAMDPVSLTSQTAFGACSGSIQVSRDDFASCIAMAGNPVLSAGNTSATVTPAPAMAFGTRYKVRVLGTVQSSLNVPLGNTFTQPTGFLTNTSPPVLSHLLISQVFGGGGNTNAPYANDFVVLHNPSAATVSLAGYALQYGSATGSTWLVNALPGGGAIPAGGFYLIQLGAGSAGGTALPVPDFIPASPLNLAATAGKVALTSDTNTLSGACPSGLSIIDFVGYGAANCSEGNPAPATTTQTSVIRQPCVDTNNNQIDFTLISPAPQNGLTTPQSCGESAANETGSSSEINFCNIQFPNSISIPSGASTPLIFAQVYHAGYTEPPGPSSIVAQIGYGPANVNPQNQAGYIWQTATYNTQVGNNDEYQTSFVVATAGSYRYASRFSLDSTNWTYCDVDGAGSNANLAFSPDQLGVMTVTTERQNRGQLTSVD
jgi:hypothetical protein